MNHRIREGSIIKTINDKTIVAPQGMLVPVMQEAIFQSGPGELVTLETMSPDGELKRHVMMTVPRPDLPLLDAAKIDSRERMAAALFGMILSPYQGGFFSSDYLVRKVVRGSIADEAGFSEQDPVSINRLRIMEDAGLALLEISVKKRRMGYLETNMQLPAWLDSPNTL
jgi:hypothetical protein